MAVLTSGAVRTWGAGFHGQLGDGTTGKEINSAWTFSLSSVLMPVGTQLFELNVCAVPDSPSPGAWAHA